MSNQASWIHAAKAPVVLGDAKIPIPGPGEILVKNNCIAFSPIDAKIQKYVSPMEDPLAFLSVCQMNVLIN